jgi:hypothetical protein
MLNRRQSNTGNQGGVIYDYVDPSNYRAVPRQWTTVGVRRIGDLTEITVQAIPIIRLKQTIVVGSKRAGLIARFNKVRFDDVVVGVAR